MKPDRPIVRHLKKYTVVAVVASSPASLGLALDVENETALPRPPVGNLTLAVPVL